MFYLFEQATNEAVNFASNAMDEIFNKTTISESSISIDLDDSDESSTAQAPIEIQTRASSSRPRTADSSASSKSTSSADDSIYSKLLEASSKVEKLQGEKELLEDEIQKYAKSNKEKSDQYKKEVSKLHEKLDQLEKDRRKTEEEQQRLKKEQARIKKEQDRVKQVKAEIKTVDYKNVEAEIVDNCLSPCHNILVKTLRKISTAKSAQVVDNPLQVIFEKYQASYTITITGFPEHHEQFTTILQKIKSATMVVQSTKQYYQRVLKRTIQSLMTTFSKVRSKIRYWSSFRKKFASNIQEKSKEYMDMFNTFIDQKLRLLGEQCISNDTIQPWIEIRKFTNQFIEDNQFIKQVERAKHQALEQFIRENISFQKTKSNKKPTEKSIKTIQNLLRKMTQIFQTKPEYKGHELEQLRRIPDLLQQIMIYYFCFTLQLPLFESAEDLLGKVEKNTVTTITTTTGSGKSHRILKF